MAITIDTGGGRGFTCDIFDRTGLDDAIKKYINEGVDALWCCQETAAIGGKITEHCVMISKLASYSVTPKTSPDDDDDDVGGTKPGIPEKPTAPPVAPVRG